MREIKPTVTKLILLKVGWIQLLISNLICILKLLEAIQTVLSRYREGKRKDKSLIKKDMHDWQAVQVSF